MTTKVTIAVTAIICLLLGGAAGYFGRPFIQQNRDLEPAGMSLARPRQNGQMLNNGRALGQVQSVTNGRLTLQTPTNGSQIIVVNGGTSYLTMAQSSANELTSGTRVLVMGQQNTDGSITAASIQIIPEGVQFPVGGRRRPGGSQLDN